MDDMARFSRMDQASSWDTMLKYDEDMGHTSHLPTPPSTEGSPVEEENTLVSVSTTFYPGQNNHGPGDASVVLVSSDSVFFYVHSETLLAASENRFDGVLDRASQSHDTQLPVAGVSESSNVLNLVLHSLYDLSAAQYTPSFDDLRDAVHALAAYGVPVQQRVNPSTSLFTLLLAHAPLRPLELYALAANYDLHDLAVPTSPHLLSFNLSSITDEVCQQMGPVYLKRLFFLHFGRADALKRLLLPPPHPHAPTPWCDFVEQKSLTRAWALASSYLVWDASPNLSTSSIESALGPLGKHLSCELCQQSLTERIKNLVVQWSVVKRTI